MYVHWPLEEERQFRLLELHPGNPGDAIKTTLVTRHVRDKPSYEAVSYCWGPAPHRDAIILVDGYDHKVGKSLYNALNSFRRPQSVRVLWVDALCINQEDVEEKMHQVRMIGEIYTNAASVLVYLGQPTEQTETDMHNLQSFLEPYTQREDAPWFHIPIPELERSISRILTRVWFERMWTVQEAVLARHIVLQCGPYRIQWTTDLRTLRSLVFRVKSAIVSPLYNLHKRHAEELDWTPLLYMLEYQMRQAARREHVVLQRNLLDVAFDFRHRHCMDPRDRYYAILAIIENERGGSFGFHADYTMSAEEVYERFRAAVQQISEIEDVPLA